ncbi:MAG: PIN domain-containing protein [Bacteroidetes bacterium]|nr:PIN domain-containing protein [Bacteroidota bacterium]
MGRIGYLLDSNICIHFIKNEGSVVSRIRKVGLMNCYLSEITILELMYGIANSQSSKKAENKAKLEQFIGGFDNRILPIRSAFDEFATQKTQLRKLGTPISDFDLLIACTSVSNNLVMVSRNVKEMGRIEGILLENWIDEKFD